VTQCKEVEWLSAKIHQETRLPSGLLLKPLKLLVLFVLLPTPPPAPLLKMAQTKA